MAERNFVQVNADLWRRTGVAHPACSGACNQGRNACPCPEACEVPATDAQERAVFWWVYIVLLIAVLSAIFLPAVAA